MKTLSCLLVVLAAGFIPAAAAEARAGARPNILLIVADDLGYGDVGCYGATKILTPNLDRLAAAGVRFTDAHAPAAVCQPSRYAILSGTYFMRARRQGKQTLYFHEGQATLPGVLKAAGYRTAALGKWHLGFGRNREPDYNAELAPGPLEVGFDSFFGCPRTHNEPPFVFVEGHRVVGLDPADPLTIVPPEATPKGQGWGHGISTGAKAAHASRPTERIDPILAGKAVEFLGQKSASPFFLYLAFLAPHVPIAPGAEFQGSSQAGRYGDFVQQLDACVGRVLDALQANGLAENTLVLFTSDNGAVLTRETLDAGHRTNAAWLGQKTDAWEGGHRVPFIARWPGRIPASAQSDRLLCLTDVMATVLAAAAVPVPEGAAPDSLNQVPVLTDPANAPAVRTEMLAQGTGGYALRQGDWVFLPKPGSCGMTVQVPAGTPWGQPYARLGLVNSDIGANGRPTADAAPVQLYDLANDPGQTTNLASREPERAKAMQRHLAELVARPSAAPPQAVRGAGNAGFNVLLLFADDQRADTIAALGNPVIRTPHLDRLARRGLAFNRAYMQGGLHGATCVPSRAMLLSGRPLFRVDEKLQRDQTWPEAFQRAGYTTFVSGKWHNGDPSLARSFQIARSVFTGGMTHPLKASLRDVADGKVGPPRPSPKHACEAFADEAIRFLQEHQGGPFFCYVPFDAPHDPHVVPPDFPVHYDPATLPLPPNLLPQHPWDNGEMTVRDEKLLPWPRSPEAVRALTAEYYRYISYLDAQIGRILEALDASPYARNTLVVFSADSGVARGSHGLIGKQNLYEHSVRVPLIIAGPGIPTDRRTDAMCYLFDLLPTLGAFCGVAAPPTSEGLDLSLVLREPSRPGRPELMFAYRQVQRAVRDERWKLIRYPLVDRTQLFDLQADPDEMANLADNPAHAETVARLMGVLAREQQRFGDSAPRTVRNPRPAAWTPPPAAPPGNPGKGKEAPP